MTGSGAPAADGSTGSSLDAEAKAEISRLVSRALELQDSGEERWLEEACADRPDLIDEVRSAVEGASQLPGLLFGQVGVDRLLGTRLADRYEVRSRLGSGSMGVVYEAYDVELRRAVAVKLLRADLFDGLKAAERFKREAHAMAAVEHAAVIAIHDRGQTDSGESYIVMDLIDGLPLSAVVEELSGTVTNPSTVTAEIVAERLNLETHRETSYVRMVARWVAELAAGLGETHRASVVHRDIKPSNVIVRRDGRPVLVDFGIAHLTEDASITRGGTSVGTPAYMPPESLSGKQVATKEGDIYGLGALLYSLVALRPPYLGTPSEVLAALSTREPDRVEHVHGGLPRDLRAIIETCMARRPSARYSDARALEEDLRAFLGHQPVKARPVGPLTRVARRLARSRAFQGATGAVLAGLLLLGNHYRVRAVEASRHVECGEILRQLPPNRPVLNHVNREVGDPEDREANAALLDRAVELCVDPLPAVLLRAAFRLDHGDPGGAAEDMRRIARHEDTGFSGRLAAAYEALPADAQDSRLVDLSSVGEPETPRDCYLRAFHHLRAGYAEDPQAMELLARPGVQDLPHAAELSLLLVFISPRDSLEVRAAKAAELIEGTLRLEGRMGGPSATTANTAAYALQMAWQYEASLAAARASIELAPRSHVNRTNAIVAALALGRHGEVREHARVALEVKPRDAKPAKSLVFSHLAERDYEGARAAVVRVAGPIEESVPHWGPLMLSTIETYRAVEIMRASVAAPDDPQVKAELAAAIAAARSHYSRAQDLGLTSEPGFTEELLNAVDTQDRDELFVTLLKLAGRAPERWWRTERMLDFFPEQLSAEDSQRVRKFIEQVASRPALQNKTTQGGR